MVHIQNLTRELALKHPFAELVCYMFGLCSFKRVQKDFADYVIGIAKDVSGVQMQPQMSKTLAELIH